MDKFGTVYAKAKIALWLKIDCVMDCAIGMQLHSHGLVKHVIEIQNQKTNM